mmetsp:Transcript_9623/g.35261  ORF Transcript_9623/g.35261 Transcript_9623/m.35261 type:complete len:205 (+) Transcript_9623:315-929(+)
MRSLNVAAISSAFSNTSAGLRSMSPGVGSSFLVDREIRPFSLSCERTITFNLSPTASTSSTLEMRSWEIWEMCRRPLLPPMSTKTPYGFTVCTTPSTTSPTFKASRPSPCALRLERTSLVRSSSTSRNFSGMVWPGSSSLGPRRGDTWDNGTKPRRPPTVTTRPPLFNSNTSPCTSSSLAIISRASAHACSYSMRRKESVREPS